MLYILGLLLFALAIFFIVQSVVESKILQPRVSLGLESGPKKQPAGVVYSSKLLKSLGFIIEPFSRLPYVQSLQRQAEILQVRFDLPSLVLFKLILAVIAGVGTLIVSAEPLFALIGAVFGFALPDFIMAGKIRKRKQEIIRFFPETIDLLNMSISAGADFLSAIRWTIEKSTPNPFIDQLSIVLSEIQVGKMRAEALKDMAVRLQLRDISSFVRALVQAERMGTSIEEAFENLSEDTRSLRFQEGERYAIKASLKILFPLIFCILPVIMIIVAGPIIIKFSSGELVPKGF